MNRSIFKKAWLILLFLVQIACLNVFSQKTRVGNLRCEYQENLLGVESIFPKLSWQLQSEKRNIFQSAYRILVADNEKSLRRNVGNIWDSKKVVSNESIQIPYSGSSLKSAGVYYWKVMIWDNHGKSSGWSAPARWQMGLLTSEDWKGAKWIAYEDIPQSRVIVPAIHQRGPKSLGELNDILPLFRKEINIKKPVKQATMFISGLGHFDLSLNGKKVGDHFLDPGWTKYDEHALYVTFDLTNRLKKGKNALGVMLGNGFYFIPRDSRYRKITGAFGFPKVIATLLVEYKDGSTQHIITDETWKTSASPITYTSIYGGEDYNATLEQPGWDIPEFNERSWKDALVVKGPRILNSQTAAPLKIFESFSVQKITQPKPGVWVYDMGQNASAIPKLTVTGTKGAKVRLIPAELLNTDGTVNQSASGSPHYYDFILKGGGVEVFQPRFTYYGFRYIQVEGAVPQKESNPGSLPVIAKLESLHMRNAAERAGQFTSSNQLFNKTDKLIDWAIKSNMVSVFTDCPHREKLGWLEEAHLVGASVRYSYDIAALCRKVVRDMIVSQTEDGLIPDIAPEYVQFTGGFRDSPEWGSNGIILPWYLYKWYGDKQVLEESYPMMQKYVDYLDKKSSGNILSHGLGDWFDIGPKRPGEAQLTPKAVTATAIYYYDLTILTEIAKLLNKQEDFEKYQHRAAAVKEAFNAKFFNKDTKQYSTGSQTANAMSVYMKLVEPEFKDAVVENMVNEIRSRNNSLSAGDIGYRYLLRVLEEEGRSDVIYDMNSRTDVPGYGWQLEHGATALTESWQAYGFVSNNHFMLGHLMEWFYSGLGGIRSAEGAIALNKIDIKPEPVGDVTSARVSYMSPYGKITSDWQKQGEKFQISVDIPANTYATIYMPSNEGQRVYESGKSVGEVEGITLKGIQSGRAVVSVGSGRYRFEVK